MAGINYLRRLFGRTGSDEEDVIIEFEEVEQEIDHTFQGTIDRTVEMIHFAQGGSLVVEYDSVEYDVIHENMQTVYESVTGFRTSSKYRTDADSCATTQYGNKVTSVNDMAVAHRETLGEIEVAIERPATLTMTYDRVENRQDLPDDVLDDEGLPSLNADRDLVRENGCEITRDKEEWGGRTKLGFERFDGEVVFDRRYRFESWDGDLRIEANREMGDVLADAISGRTDGMKAVSADGQVLLSDSDGTTGDVVQVQSLPSGGRE